MKDYLFCPRYFFYRKVHHLSLIPLTIGILAQERVDDFTFGFFTNLSKWNEETSVKTRFDLEYLLSSKFFTHLETDARTGDLDFRKLDEKVFTLLSWLAVYLWGKITPNIERYFIPIMVNEFIQAPSLNLQGRPSAVFKQPNNSALILIQTLRLEFPHTRCLVTLQAALYARILDTMGIKAQNFLYVNYHRMDLLFQDLKQNDFNSLDDILKDFQIAMREENFDPPENPPCEICEFKWICKDLTLP